MLLEKLTLKQTFNPLLVEMIKGVNQEIGAHVFIAVNAYEMHMDFVTNPQAFGTCTTIDKLLNYLTII